MLVNFISSVAPSRILPHLLSALKTLIVII